jgi:hypothetical protein
VPIRSKRPTGGSDLADHTYYIRRPGPESARPDSGSDWDALIGRCRDNDYERQLAGFRRILSVLGRDQEVARQIAISPGGRLEQWISESTERLRALEGGADSYSLGWWSCAYYLDPVKTTSLAEFRNILLEVKGHETGWPGWLTGSERPGPDNTIECWIDDMESFDFWRASPLGRMFLLRRLQEDWDFRSASPGSFIDLILPIWRTGECLLHASRLAARLKSETVEIQMTWHGLAGRELRALAGPIARSVMPGKICGVAEIKSSTFVHASDISDTLPELVKTLVSPLYQHFDFFDPGDQLYSSELHRMRSGI